MRCAKQSTYASLLFLLPSFKLNSTPQMLTWIQLQFKRPSHRLLPFHLSRVLWLLPDSNVSSLPLHACHSIDCDVLHILNSPSTMTIAMALQTQTNQNSQHTALKTWHLPQRLIRFKSYSYHDLLYRYHYWTIQKLVHESKVYTEFIIAFPLTFSLTLFLSCRQSKSVVSTALQHSATELHNDRKFLAHWHFAITVRTFNNQNFPCWCHLLIISIISPYAHAPLVVKLAAGLRSNEFEVSRDMLVTWLHKVHQRNRCASASAIKFRQSHAAASNLCCSKLGHGGKSV